MKIEGTIRRIMVHVTNEDGAKFQMMAMPQAGCWIGVDFDYDVVIAPMATDGGFHAGEIHEPDYITQEQRNALYRNFIRLRELPPVMSHEKAGS